MSQRSFETIQALPPSPARTAAIAAWFQGLYPAARDAPVLVGGAAVELYTRGSYTTGDLDFVGDIPPEIERELKRVGFVKTGRHWVHRRGHIFIELPARAFDRETRTDIVVFGRWSVLVLAPEDLLVDRLAAWKFWKVVVEGVNAFLLWQERGAEMDPSWLDKLARKEGLTEALCSLRSFAAQTEKVDPGIERVEEWARSVR
ncbi:MAG TPA: hypothetical protein VM737_06490 [Gemmatimonadota bacterium]|nr:hypothetical protein [Gemmatimonadota bacterium]